MSSRATTSRFPRKPTSGRPAVRLLAHPVALLRGCDADPPRNLAQSVTVE